MAKEARTPLALRQTAAALVERRCRALGCPITPEAREGAVRRAASELAAHVEHVGRSSRQARARVIERFGDPGGRISTRIAEIDRAPAGGSFGVAADGAVRANGARYQLVVRRLEGGDVAGALRSLAALELGADEVLVDWAHDGDGAWAATLQRADGTREPNPSLVGLARLVVFGDLALREAHTLLR